MISGPVCHKNLYGCNHKEEGVTLKDRYDKEFTAKCIVTHGKLRIQISVYPAIISFTTVSPTAC